MRTFYSWQTKGTPVRLDLFCQQFGSSAESFRLAEDIQERVGLIDELIEVSEPTILASGHYLSVPRDLAVISKSVRWSEETFRRTLQEHLQSLEREIDRHLLSPVLKDGILSLEPETAAAKDRYDRSYAEELLYFALDQEVASAGVRTGLTNFLRQRLRK